MKHLEKWQICLTKQHIGYKDYVQTNGVIQTHQTRLPLEREVQLHNWYSVSVTHCIKKK